MAISSDYQFQFTSAAGDIVLMGAETNYDVVDIRGLGMPSVRANDIDRLDTHGALTSRKELLPGRTINLQVVVQGTPGDELDARMTTLMAACQVADTPGVLSFQFPIGYGTTTSSNDVRAISAYCRRVTKQVIASNSAGRIPCYIQFECPNPIIRSYVKNTTLIELSDFTGGTEFPDSFPLTFGTGSSLASIINNSGNFISYPIVRFPGPLNSPGIQNNTKGETVQLAGVSILAGDYVDIDFYERSILQSGTTSIYNTLTQASTWWTLQPGNNSVTFIASSSTAVEMSFNWYDSWI